MTYQEFYLAALYSALEEGGEQSFIERAVAEINNPTQKNFDAFIEARSASPLPCNTCGEPFSLAGKKPALTEEVLCSSCNTTKNPS